MAKKTLLTMLQKAANYRPATIQDVGQKCVNCKHTIQMKDNKLSCLCMIPEQFIN